MSSTVAQILIRVALWLLPSFEAWLQQVLGSNMPPGVEPVLHQEMVKFFSGLLKQPTQLK